MSTLRAPQTRSTAHARRRRCWANCEQPPTKASRSSGRHRSAVAPGRHVRSIAELVGPLDRALRNTRVLIRRVVVSARLDETMPPDYLCCSTSSPTSTDDIADRLAANESPESSAATRSIEIAEATSDASEPLTLSAAVVLARSGPSSSTCSS